MSAAGTIESLAKVLAETAAPLARWLSPAEVDHFFAELGLQFTPSITTQPSLLAALEAASARADDLAASADALSGAIASRDSPAMIAAGLSTIGKLANFFQRLDHIGQELNAHAGAFPGIGAGDVSTFAATLGKRIFEAAAVARLESVAPEVASGLAIIGIIDRHFDSGTPGDPAKPPFEVRRLRLDRIPDFLRSPATYLGNLYGWGSPGFDGKFLLQQIEELAAFSGLPAVLVPKPGGLLGLDLLFVELDLDETVTPPALRATLQIPTQSHFTKRVPLPLPGWYAEISSSDQLPSGLVAQIKPPASFSLTPPGGQVQGDISIGVGAEATGDKFTLLGLSGGTRLEARKVAGNAAFHFAWDPASGSARAEPIITAEFDEADLNIDLSGGDAFITSITGGGIFRANLDLRAHWSPTAGFQIEGSSAIEIAIPVHTSAGPVNIESLYLKLGIGADGSLRAELSSGFSLNLGPLKAAVDRIGLTVGTTFPNQGGNLGPANLAFAFKPPNGIGLSLDVGIIKGGGFLSFDVDKGEYAGAMELDFIGIISLKAIAIINTKMPDGSNGFSLLIIITADFPPIQLGFGFTLNAVGGLLGLNRTVNIEALREGVRTNAIKSVLFPQDVIANITRIVSDLKQIFPPLNERFIVGPMAELGWGTPSIITLELGILIEIPVPRIAILGVLAAFLPAEELALLRIQVNFLGVIDFENKYISFDASLFDSRLLIYTLTGDMAFRLSWGDNPMFVLSVGGFHPAYHDAPQDLQHMTRLGISLLGGDNPRISVMSYFAVTSNTVQFGARAELYAEAAGFNVYGFIGFDVLFQFDPFKFIASFEAGLALREGTDTIMGIHLAGQLSGINPWNARGEASITILFLKISVSFDETWGDSADKIDPPKEDIVARLTAEINDDRNWKAEIPDSNNLHVSIRKMELPPGQVVIHPMGVLTFSERLVPLAIEITKFGNKVPLNARRFDIRATDPGVLTQTVTEEFAPADFFAKTDNEKLSSPSFDRLTSGFKVTGASSLVMPAAVNKSVEYELTYLREKRTQLFRAGEYRMANQVFKASTKASAATVSTLSYARNRISVNAPDAVAVEPPQYAVANVSDMRLAGADLVAGSYTEAQQKYSALIARRPELKDQVQVLAHHELNRD
jgi:hypothetical protein